MHEPELVGNSTSRSPLLEATLLGAELSIVATITTILLGFMNI
jgi:hypothetical protein